MLITIFTPLFNRARYLERIYQSILNQNDLEIEWIIVDDGSNDRPKSIIDPWIAEANFKIVYQYQNNQGKHRAINKGVGLASGVYFFILDSDDYLPKYSESRCIAISIKLIKKNAPQIKWIISFADGTQCGDGTIYRASGFKLVGIVDNTALRMNPKTGEAMHVIQAHHLKMSSEFRSWKPFKGKQLKYIYLIDKNMVITKEVLPFTEIDKQGAGMYKGEKITLQERRVND